MRKVLASLFFALIACCAGAAVAAPVVFKADDDPAASPIWQKVHASLFQGRRVLPGQDVVQLEAPARAIDAAVVPVAIRGKMAQTAERYVAKLYLIIDGNPSPIAAIVSFAPEYRRVDLETRVRIDQYSHVRAIAETNDGQLYMTTRFVKASGGCSAPAGSDAKAALATMGQMRFRFEGEPRGKEPVAAQLTISHPNHSGLAMDQYTRQFTPAHFVRRIEISQGSKPLLNADVDFSFSENPSLRFWFVPDEGGDLRATIVDSHDLRFASAQALPGRP